MAFKMGVAPSAVSPISPTKLLRVVQNRFHVMGIVLRDVVKYLMVLFIEENKKDELLKGELMRESQGGSEKDTVNDIRIGVIHWSESIERGIIMCFGFKDQLIIVGSADFPAQVEVTLEVKFVMHDFWLDIRNVPIERFNTNLLNK